jgi:hypothetical protein
MYYTSTKNWMMEPVPVDMNEDRIREREKDHIQLQH